MSYRADREKRAQQMMPDEQRCEALMYDCYMRPTQDRCCHFASVEIPAYSDGQFKVRRCCVKHAQIIALHEALRTGQAKRMPKAAMPLPARPFRSSKD